MKFVKINQFKLRRQEKEEEFYLANKSEVSLMKWTANFIKKLSN